MSGHAGIMHRACMFMWRKLNGTGSVPGAADAVTYTLVWAGGKRKKPLENGWSRRGADRRRRLLKSARPMPFEIFAFRRLPGLAVRGGAQRQ